MSVWTNGLNPEQVKAVLHDYGPLLILAGAGSGKTTVLVSRAGRMIEDRVVMPKELCVLTFTNKAARELKSRVTAKLGASGSKGIWASTFHSFGLHWLRKFHKKARLSEHFGIMDSSDAGSMVKELLRDFNYESKTAFDADKVLSLISLWRERGQREAKVEDPYEAAVEWVLPKYLKRLEILGMVDFDSLILRPLELMQEDAEVKATIQAAYTQVMVDEFQDTNQMQMQFIRALVESHKNISVVGDDDQSIYGWRGACISNILDFPKLYANCETIRLERNYRSTQSILKLANAVIEKNSKRHGKVLRSEKSATEDVIPEIFIHDTEIEEAEAVAREISDFLRDGKQKKDVAILYRANSQGALIEGELRRLQIPYSQTGGTGFFDRKETRDILAYLRCSINPNEISMRRVINTPPRGIGEKTIDAITAFSESHQIKFVEAVKRGQEIDAEEKAKNSMRDFLTLLDSMRARMMTDLTSSAGDKLLSILDEIGYRKHIEMYAGNALVATKRWKWVETFARILDTYLEKGGRTVSTLRNFLDSMELRDVMNDEKKDEDRVQLMTLHACKGLEFPVVFLMGLEEDLLPHKTLGLDIAEERRLFYVGITRAQERLIMSRAQKRRKYGKWTDSAPSRFLLEIPAELIKEHQGGRPVSNDQRKSMIADLFKKIDSLSSVPKPI